MKIRSKKISKKGYRITPKKKKVKKIVIIDGHEVMTVDGYDGLIDFVNKLCAKQERKHES